MAAIPTEADVTINGVRLSPAEAMALRVAVASWLMELHDDPDCLGNDEHGRFMHKSYQQSLLNIQQLMFQKPL